MDPICHYYILYLQINRWKLLNRSPIRCSVIIFLTLICLSRQFNSSRMKPNNTFYRVNHFSPFTLHSLCSQYLWPVFIKLDPAQLQIIVYISHTIFNHGHLALQLCWSKINDLTIGCGSSNPLSHPNATLHHKQGTTILSLFVICVEYSELLPDTFTPLPT